MAGLSQRVDSHQGPARFLSMCPLCLLERPLLPKAGSPHGSKMEACHSSDFVLPGGGLCPSIPFKSSGAPSNWTSLGCMSMAESMTWLGDGMNWLA